MWSAQEDAQLIGRAHRQGQDKCVHMYRTIADQTPDIALNTISFTKEAMQTAFLTAPSTLRKQPQYLDSGSIHVDTDCVLHLI